MTQFNGEAPQPLEESDLLTVKEVAKLLRIHPKKVYALPIPRVRLSVRRIRFSRRAVQSFVSANREAA